jgi:hypothetical protein
MNEAVTNLTGQIRPQFEAEAALLREQFPNCRFVIHELTSSTFPGFYLSCLFPDASREDPDELAFCLNFFDSKDGYRVMADITWGHPSGHVEDSIPFDWESNDEWPLLTAEVSAIIHGDIPRLLASFRKAVDRGSPPGL